MTLLEPRMHLIVTMEVQSTTMAFLGVGGQLVPIHTLSVEEGKAKGEGTSCKTSSGENKTIQNPQICKLLAKWEIWNSN